MIEHGEPVLKNQDQEDDDEILNICDYINFDDFSGDDEFFSDLFVDNNNFSSSSSQRSSSSSSPSSPLSCVEQGGSVSPLSTDESSEGSIWIRQIEEMLLKDDDNNGENNDQQGFVEDDFFADLDFPLIEQQQQEESQFQCSDQVRISIDGDDDFMDVFNDVQIEETDEFGVVFDYVKPTCQLQVSSENSYPDKEGTSDSSEDKDEEVDEKKRAHESDDNEDNEDDDPITKKRKRQMRNRDAAVRSRERKKLYVKDLELKSKYLEGECIRLQRLLQYCTAENHALHLQLQEKAIAASRTMQESAVLLLESLLLGSLLWFLAMVVGLFSPLEMLLKQQLPARSAVVVSVGSNNRRVVALERAQSKKRVGIGTIDKRGKASRSKMRDVVGCYAAAAA
ncbi:hypothetical protein ACHQM5_025382 [Ranunculus cassubicifolius]